MRPFHLLDWWAKKMFQLYRSPLSANYEDVDRGNIDGRTTKREEWTGPSLYAGQQKDGASSAYVFIVLLLQNVEQKGSQSFLSSVPGAGAVTDRSPTFGLFWRFRSALTEQVQCARRTWAKLWSWLWVCWFQKALELFLKFYVIPVYSCNVQKGQEGVVSSAQCTPCAAQTGRSELIISVLPRCTKTVCYKFLIPLPLPLPTLSKNLPPLFI